MQGHFQIMFSWQHCPLLQRGLPLAMRIMYISGVWSYIVGAISTPLFILVPMITIWCVPQSPSLHVSAVSHPLRLFAPHHYFTVAQPVLIIGWSLQMLRLLTKRGTFHTPKERV